MLTSLKPLDTTTMFVIMAYQVLTFTIERWRRQPLGLH